MIPPSSSPERLGRSTIASHIPGLVARWRRMGTQWRQSTLRTFLIWWRAGLLDCLPQRIRAVVDRRDADILLVLDADVRPHASAHATEVIHGLDRPYNAAPGTRVILVLPRRAVLIKPMRFPLAARDNLRAIAAFELDRQTPFSLDQAAFDVHLPNTESLYGANLGAHYSGRQGARDGGQQNRIDADLIVMPKATLDALTRQIASAHWPLHGVDVVTAEGHRLGVNLLDPVSRAARRTPERRRTAWLTAACLVFTAVACYQWQSARETALTDMQTRVNALRVAAHSVMRLREQVRDQASMASYLTRLKASRPGMDQVLFELTTALPNDSWLQQIEADATGQVRFAGLSAHATALLTRLQQAKSLRDVSFQGAIEPDQQTHLDHFYLAGRLSTPSSGPSSASTSARSTALPADNTRRPTTRAEHLDN